MFDEEINSTCYEYWRYSFGRFVITAKPEMAIRTAVSGGIAYYHLCA